MQDDDIDLERTIIDPAYRRRVVERLNANARGNGGRDVGGCLRPETPPISLDPE